MPTPKKSASQITGHKINKKELQKLMSIEKALNGANDQLAEVSEDMDEGVRAHYIQLLERLNLSILSNIDKPLLIQTAETLNSIDICNADISDRGLVIDNKPNAHCKLLKELTQTYLNISKLLGLSPEARINFSRELNNSTELISNEKKNQTEYDKEVLNNTDEGWL